jgi:hypothetical protein
MATRSCPQCSTQYVASVRRCIDCDVMLVDDVESGDLPAGGSTAAPLGDGDQIAYELEGWGNQLKVTLEGMLDRAEVRRVWEAGALVVSASDEEVVDDLIATLEGDEVAELPTGDVQVAFEIEGLHADDLAELDARLIAESVPHAWDEEGALLVAPDDEDRVSAIIDEVIEGVDDEADGLDALQVLSDVYVATDRLVRHPSDRKPATAFVTAVRRLDGLALPYGFAAEDWNALVAQVDDVAELIAPWADVEVDTETETADPDEVEPEVDPADDTDEADDGDESGVVDEPTDADADEDDGDDGPQTERVFQRAQVFDRADAPDGDHDPDPAPNVGEGDAIVEADDDDDPDPAPNVGEGDAIVEADDDDATADDGDGDGDDDDSDDEDEGDEADEADAEVAQTPVEVAREAVVALRARLLDYV